MSLTLQDARQLQGATMNGTDGGKIGKVSEVYLDQDTQTPEWALVHTGLFGSKSSFVPLAQASLAGDSLTVPYTKAQIKDAPTAEPDGELSQSEEAALYAHYGLPYSESQSDSGLPAAGGTTTATTTTQTQPGTAGRDTARTDDAMTRSEERLQVGTERVTTGRVKLRKYVVTENVHQTVPVTSDRAVVTREPITDANRAQALDGPEITEAVHEEVLYSERPVVQKEVVAVERIRAEKAVVTENVQVNETLRKEQIELEDDTHGGTGGTGGGRR